MSHSARFGRSMLMAGLLLGTTINAGCAGAPKKPSSAADESMVAAKPVPMPAKPKAEIREVASFNDKLATTMAISKSGRKFVNFPRWFKELEAP